MLEAEPGARVLLAAPANYSADLLASALAAAGISLDELLRLNDPRRPVNQARACFCRLQVYAGTSEARLRCTS